MCKLITNNITCFYIQKNKWLENVTKIIFIILFFSNDERGSSARNPSAQRLTAQHIFQNGGPVQGKGTPT
jgi:hypothetical protein